MGRARSNDNATQGEVPDMGFDTGPGANAASPRGHNTPVQETQAGVKADSKHDDRNEDDKTDKTDKSDKSEKLEKSTDGASDDEQEKQDKKPSK